MILAVKYACCMGLPNDMFGIALSQRIPYVLGNMSTKHTPDGQSDLPLHGAVDLPPKEVL